MKYLACKQGEPAWYSARTGVITASEFATAIDVLSRVSKSKRAGDPTDASDKYAAEKAIERISAQPWGEPIKPWVLQRGHDLEPFARLAYEQKSGNIAEEAGVCLTDDGIFGYSTDGMVNPVFVQREVDTPLSEGRQGDTLRTVERRHLRECEGLIEIKCPVDGRKILEIWRYDDISEYFEQMQGGMWITGARWCDFVMYVPDLAPVGRDVYVRRVPRDDVFIDAMVRKLVAFNARVEQYRELLGAPANDAAWPLPKAA